MSEPTGPGEDLTMGLQIVDAIWMYHNAHPEHTTDLAITLGLADFTQGTKRTTHGQLALEDATGSAVEALRWLGEVWWRNSNPTAEETTE